MHDFPPFSIVHTKYVWYPRSDSPDRLHFFWRICPFILYKLVLLCHFWVSVDLTLKLSRPNKGYKASPHYIRTRSCEHKSFERKLFFKCCKSLRTNVTAPSHFLNTSRMSRNATARTFWETGGPPLFFCRKKTPRNKIYVDNCKLAPSRTSLQLTSKLL
jgi:hypothetical protein